jgi:hypothetical protein
VCKVFGVFEHGNKDVDSIVCMFHIHIRDLCLGLLGCIPRETKTCATVSLSLFPNF